MASLDHRQHNVDEFVGYSDESASPDNRFRSIGLLTGRRDALSCLRDRLADVLHTRCVNELKWVETRTHRSKLQTCHDFIELALQFVVDGRARIGVITWDTYDSRHSVEGRDDAANFARMSYRLLTHAARQWNARQWTFHPDEGSLLDTVELRDVLDNTRLSMSEKAMQLPMRDLAEPAVFLNVASIQALDSSREPLIQVADLFAGMVCFSRHKSGQCCEWLYRRADGAQHMLPWDWEQDRPQPTETDRNRLNAIGELDRLCKANRLGVSLRDRGYLWTPRARGPLNFWHYEPQGEYDKAPTRSQSDL